MSSWPDRFLIDGILRKAIKLVPNLIVDKSYLPIAQVADELGRNLK